MKSRLLAALATALTALAAAAAAKPIIFNHVDHAAMETWVERQMRALTPEQRVAQLIVMAVDPQDNEATRALVRRYVEQNGVGGLIYNECTMHELATVTNYAQGLARVPLLMTIDGEWGLAMRVDGAPGYPRNLALGAIDDDRLLYRYGREVARQCRLAGVHVNFAPVLDVNDNPRNPVIGSRSFGESPERVARQAIAYARGLEDGGVLAVGKHFPGHGSSVADSHKTLPLIDKSMLELNTCELAPFRQFVDAGLGGILTAHLNVPAIDGSERPTTMSARAVTKLLKQQMGFSGLVFTDALVMAGAQRGLTGSACVAALLAGNDVLLMPANADAEVRSVMSAVADGTLSQADIDERCRKMLRFKFALGLAEPQRVAEVGMAQGVGGGQAQAVGRDLVAGAVTVLKNHKGVLPLTRLQSRRIAVVTLGGDDGERGITHRRADSYAAVTHYHLPAGQSAEALATKINDGRYTTVLVTLCADDAACRAALATLAKHCRHLVVTLTCRPYDIERCAGALAGDHIDAVVLTYQGGDTAEDYAMQTIFGGNAARGSLPVTVRCAGKTYKAGHGEHYAATRLGFALPGEVGVDDRLLDQIDSVARVGLREKAFPGCQVLIARHGKVICDRAYGETDFGSGVAVDQNTLYGLASVSKATGTLAAVMKAYDDGKFSLDEPVSRVVTELRGTDKAGLTFRDLLYHETGMPPSLNMWTMMMDPATYSGDLIASKPDDDHSIKIMNGAYGHNAARLRTDILADHPTETLNVAIADGIWGGRPTYDSIMQRIYHAGLGTKTYRYSCLNFCLLADAMQRLTHSPLNYFVNTYVFAPLGAYHTLYRPLSRFPREQIAYTERDTYLRRQHIHGYVHDELAAFSGGVQGNAGLFSNATDLAKLLQMWLNGGTYGGVRFLKPSTVETFTTQKSANSHRGLGFDKPVPGDPDASNTCAEATPETYGHTGFTGTCFWVDPKNDMFYIFLCNRVSPTRNNPAFTRVSPRSHIHSLLYRSLKN